MNFNSDTVKKMTATIQEALRNLGFGVQIMDSFRDLGYDSDENGAYNQVRSIKWPRHVKLSVISAYNLLHWVCFCL